MLPSKGNRCVPNHQIALDDQAGIQACLLQALKLLAEMQRNRSIAPAYKRDAERVLANPVAKVLLLRA